MPFVKQIALCLNIGVPGYLFIDQLFHYEFSDANSTLIEVLIHFLKASVVLLSPLLHVLALMNPSYCYKGHCPPPHHYSKTQSQQKQAQSQNPYHHIKYHQEKVKFNDDLIQQSITSSKGDFTTRRQKQKTHYPTRQHQFQSLHNIDQFLSINKDQELQSPKTQAHNNQNKSIKKVDATDSLLCNLSSPPVLSKFSVSYQQLLGSNKVDEKDNNNSNINEFSTLPFFGRPSHKSVSNLGNIDSPRYSRKSIIHAGQGSIAQPLMLKLTPIKSRQVNEEQMLKEYSNRANRQRLSEQQMMRDEIDNQENTYTRHMNHHKLQQSQPYLPTTTIPYKHITYPQQQSLNNIQCQWCQQCHLPKYLRMKHCYRCSKCVHKYDHHCVLLNICIGEKNQKYYITFLYAHFYNTCLVLMQLMSGIKNDVTIDTATGVQTIDNIYTLKALSIIMLLLNFVLTIYLIFIHTQFLFNGFTTYEKERKLTINYFKHIKRNYLFIEELRHMTREEIENYHPFNQGFIRNALNVIMPTAKPIDWRMPFQSQSQQHDLKMVEMKDMKQVAKTNLTPTHPPKLDTCEWGQQSSSSNNFHKTTKSRQSALRRSKQTQQLPPTRKNLCR